MPMVMGFFGKGGSGKSTVATQMVFLLQQKKANTILAVDADHNMDLSFNLTNGLPQKYAPQLNEGAHDIKEYVHIGPSQKFSDAFLQETKTRFTINPQDTFTKKYAHSVADNTDLMITGFKTDKVLHEKACAHSLSAPLKVYLPLLQLSENDFVIVDEKAGADGVTTGIVSGIDVAIIVCEPALHSIKTAKQIADLMNFYGTPYVFVGNKVAHDEDKQFILEALGFEPSAYITESKSIKQNPSTFCNDWETTLENIFSEAKAINTNSRYERTCEKYKVNREIVLS